MVKTKSKRRRESRVLNEAGENRRRMRRRRKRKRLRDPIFFFSKISVMPKHSRKDSVTVLGGTQHPVSDTSSLFT